MKFRTPFLVILAALPAVSQAQTLLAGWDRWTDPSVGSTRSATDRLNTDITGTASWGANWISGGQGGSTTGTFGPNISGADPTTGGVSSLRIREPSTIQFEVSNNSATESYTLSEIGFDFWRSFGGSPTSYDLSVTGDVTNTILVTGGSFGAAFGSDPTNGGPNVYNASSITLTGLADRTLDVGESATFLFSINDGTGSANTFIDNVAIAIPEPSAYTVLAGLAVAGFALLRRRGR